MKKIILLNAGAKTRSAFALGLDGHALECYRTKEIILHIDEDFSIQFIHNSIPIDFTNSIVCTRLRGNDEVFTGILYEHLASLGIPAMDPINISYPMSGEKIAQMSRLARAGVPIPKTLILREESFALHKEYIFNHTQFPIVYKTDGNKGEAVFLIETFAELEKKVAEKEPCELFMLQRYLPNDFDTRTLVAYGTVLGSIKRTSAANGFLNNYSQGGTVDNYIITDSEAEICKRAVTASGLDFGGVDIIHTPTGPYILEVNKSPQINGFESIHGEDTVFKRLAEIITKQ